MEINDAIGLDCLDLIEKLSDKIRIVDPIKKSVIEFKDKSMVIQGLHCFDFWGKNKVCDNCISMRAYNNNQTYVKIEYSKNSVYMVTAIPHSIDGRTIVIEILKDITKSILFDSGNDPSSDQAGIHALIDNMNRFSFIDSLTGIYNRRYIMEKLPVDMLNSTLSSNKFSIIMVDIDFFKSINDNYGHITGDHTLKKVAETLSSCIKRTSDWLARFGGEEFIICMPGAALDVAIKTAEYMRETLENLMIQDNGAEFSVTASFGVYRINPAENVSAEELIKRADEKLYSAKRNGRNRVEY